MTCHERPSPPAQWVLVHSLTSPSLQSVYLSHCSSSSVTAGVVQCTYLTRSPKCSDVTAVACCCSCVAAVCCLSVVCSIKWLISQWLTSELKKRKNINSTNNMYTITSWNWPASFWYSSAVTLQGIQQPSPVRMFYVAEFGNGSVEVVPENWLLDNGHSCYWPLTCGKQTLDDIMHQKIPERTWKKTRINTVMIRKNLQC